MRGRIIGSTLTAAAVALTAFVIATSSGGGGGSPTPTPTPTPTATPGLPSCTQTISTSSAYQSAVTGASAGAVVCLNSGTYTPTGTIFDASHASFVTFRPADGASAIIADSDYNNVDHVRWQGFSGGSHIEAGISFLASDHVELISNLITTGGDGIDLNGCQSCAITGNTITGISHVCDSDGGYGMHLNAHYDGTGRTGFDGLQNLVIQDNDIGNIVGQDGIQIGGLDDGATDITINHNSFHDIHSNTSCDSDHSDSIQLIGGTRDTITNNTFRRVQNACLIGDDRLTDAVFTNNLMIGDTGVAGGVGNFCQIFDAIRLVFRNNVVIRAPGATWLNGLLLRSQIITTSGGSTGLSATVENNVLQDSDTNVPGSGTYSLTQAQNVTVTGAGSVATAANYGTSNVNFPFDDSTSFVPKASFTSIIDQANGNAPSTDLNGSSIFDNPGVGNAAGGSGRDIGAVERTGT